MGVHLLNQPVPGAALYLLQNLGTCKDVSIPAVPCKQYYWPWAKLRALTILLTSFRSLYVNMVGLWITVSLAVFSGLTMFSIYKNCDPLTNDDISTPDQVNVAAIVSLLIVTRTACCTTCNKALTVKNGLHLYTSCCPTLWWISWQLTLESLACLWPQHTVAPLGEAWHWKMYFVTSLRNSVWIRKCSSR